MKPRITKTGPVTKNGNTWRFAYYVQGDIRRRWKRLGHCTSKRDADLKKQTWLNKAMVQPIKHTSSDPYTLWEWLVYMRDVVLVDRADGTQQTYSGTSHKLLQSVGDKPLPQITTADAQRFKSDLIANRLAGRQGDKGRQIKSAATVKRHLVTASSIFNEAVRTQLIDDNPFAGVTVMVEKPLGDWYYISHAESELLMTSCWTIYQRVAIAMARWAGLRRGEIRVAQWDDIDLGESSMRVRSDKTKRTGNSSRRVPINDRLMAVLQQARIARSGPLVCGPNMASRKNMTEMLRRVMARAGVDWEAPWHDLRRSRCQDLADAGIPVKDAASIMGHSVNVMMAYYLQAEGEGFKKAKAV